MIRFLSVAAAILVGGTVAYAQVAGGDAIKQRKAAMKELSGAGKSNAQMVKGEKPFDAATAKANLEKIAAAAIKSKDLYPDNSKTGETAALPAVWEKKADFMAKFDKLAADAKAVAASVKDKDSLAAGIKRVGANCGSCHKDYRAKKK